MNRPAGCLCLLALLVAAAERAHAQAQAIRCGETVERVLQGGTTDALRFDAREGEVTSITVARGAAGGTFTDLRWDLLDAKGDPVATSDGATTCHGQCETVPLPATGPFTIRVFDHGGSGSGDYAVSLEAVSATANGVSNGPPAPTCARTVGGEPEGTRVLPLAQPLRGAVRVPAETDTFTLVGQQGEVLALNLTAVGTARPFDPSWALFDPSGERVMMDDGAALCTCNCLTRPLPASGTFTVKVFDGAHDASGLYALLRVDLTATTTTTSTTATTTSATTGSSTTTSTTTVSTPTTTSTTLGTGRGRLFDLAGTWRGSPPAAGSPSGVGATLAAAGGRLHLGAPRDDTGGFETGAVFVVDTQGGVGSVGFGHLARTLLKPGSRAAGDAFGAAIAAIGVDVVVGVPGDDQLATDAGAAYLFPESGEARRLAPPSPMDGARFGAAVGAVGSDVLVGAPGAGAAYLFSRATSGLLHSFTSPGSATGTLFGSSLLALGSRVVVGAPGRVGQVFVFEGQSAEPALTLGSPAMETGDEFGFALAAAGDDLVVSAPGAAGGAGRVFLFDGSTGTLVRTFENPTPVAGERFGNALAVDGRALVVGTPADGPGVVYRFDLATGAVLEVIRRADARPGDGFGTAVLPTPSGLAIGAPGDSIGTVEGGAAYLVDGRTVEAVFRRHLTNAGLGTAVATSGTLVAAGGPAGGMGGGAVAVFDPTTGETLSSAEAGGGGSLFGFSLAPFGAGFLIGAPFEGQGGTAGAVYLLDGSTPHQPFVVPGPEPGDQIGYAVAGTSADAVVGAPLAGPRDTGLVYLFDGATGALRRTLDKPVPVAGDFFGAAVAAEGDDVVVGAPFDGTALVNAGAAYLFRRSTAELVHTLVSPTAASGDLFGAAVALSSTKVAVGAPLSDTGAVDAGRVYVFDRANSGHLATIDNPTPATNDQFGTAVAFAGDALIVGAPLDDQRMLDTGTAYVFDAATGALLQELPNPAQGAFDHYGSSVATIGRELLVGSPGPSRVYTFKPTGEVDVLGGRGASRARPLIAPAEGAECGNGIVEGNEACDDGNTNDLDDCRSNCTGRACCILDPQADVRCDDGNPCTDDVVDPVTGCQNPDNGTCCVRDSGCAEGRCRVCVGCFLHPWACCSRGAGCLTLSPECAGSQCLSAAFCECEGGLVCGDQTVDVAVSALFRQACDQLRLEASVAPGGAGGLAQLKVSRTRTRSARKLIRKTATLTRKLTKRGTVSAPCRAQVFSKVKLVKKAIPRGRRLRRCVLGR